MTQKELLPIHFSLTEEIIKTVREERGFKLTASHSNGLISFTLSSAPTLRRFSFSPQNENIRTNLPKFCVRPYTIINNSLIEESIKLTCVDGS